MTLSPPLFHRQQLELLQSQLAAPLWHSRSCFSIRTPALKTLFRSAGLPEGALLELLCSCAGAGAWELALLLARELQQQRFTLILIDNFREFFPPGAAQLGVDLERLIVVRPQSLADQLWSMEQALRCSGQTVVLSTLGRIPPNAYRRLKLAAEKGKGLGIFLRPAGLRGSPSWADRRLLIEGAPSLSRSRRYAVTALNSLEGTAPHTLLELCDDSGTLSVVSPMADSAPSAKHPCAS